jgi:predicted DNA-binding protein
VLRAGQQPRSLEGGEEMKEKSIIVSIRVEPELYKEVKKRAIDRDDTVTAIVKRAFERYIEEGKEMEKKSLKAKILKAWYEQDFSKTADELLAAADVWKNGSSDGIVVWDTEKEELSVVRESATTYTPSFIYLHRLPGNYKPDIDEEELFFDLKELDIEDVLEKAID